MATSPTVAQNGNLPVFTSPIDVAGYPIQLHAVAPDSTTGKPVDVAIPAGLLTPQLNQFFATPLSTQIDQYWGVTRDPKTHLTPRESACSGAGGSNGIIPQVESAVRKAGTGFNAYDVSCDLAMKGKLLAQQVGATLYLAYLLTNNKVQFGVTTPVTCHPGHGTPACPDDPRIVVTFASEIVTVLHTAGLCQLSAEKRNRDHLSRQHRTEQESGRHSRVAGGQPGIGAQVSIGRTGNRKHRASGASAVGRLFP
ncbi:MAG: hypothetical protein JO336_23865, partial [Acidobacteriia bacterium]|nr:hypothetical protein [Terriglobia bacterium]